MPTSSARLSHDASFGTTLSSPLGEHEFDSDRVGVYSSKADLSKQQQMLGLMDELQSTDLQTDIDIPRIAVIGQKGTGKSSLVEAISGVSLPMANGTCASCPTEYCLARASGPWNCTVFLRYTMDDRGQRLSKIRHEQFGPVITNPDHVEERHRRAQLAILNPNTPSKMFLEGEGPSAKDCEANFSVNCVSLKIKGPDVADLYLCDLPDLAYSTEAYEGDKKFVEELLVTYIKNPNYVILVTIACETEFDTQEAFDLVKQHDPDLKRTIGVLMMPDYITTDKEDRRIRVRDTRNLSLLGRYGVKQPDLVQLRESNTYPGVRSREAEFLSTIAPWAQLSFDEQDQLSTARVVDRLSKTLSDLIAKRLPEMEQEIQRQKEYVERSLNKLPIALSLDPLTEMVNLLTNFSNAVIYNIEGTPDEDGLVQAIRPHQETFQHAIRTLAPDFHLCKQADAGFVSLSPLMDVFHSGDRSLPNSVRAVYLEDVLKAAQVARTRNSPNDYLSVVTERYIQLYIGKWKPPALAFFNAVIEVVTGHMTKIFKDHFERFTHGHLFETASISFLSHMKKAEDMARQSVLWLLELEARPFTLNTEVLAYHREKFLAYYKGGLQTVEHDILVKSLDPYKPEVGAALSDTTEFQARMSKAMTGLAEIDLIGTGIGNLPSHLPTDRLGSALEIMASVQAYYEVASRRFIDSVPQAVDCDYVNGMHKGLLDVLVRDIMRGPDVRERCRQFLREDPALSMRREELEGKRDRLEKTQTKFMQLF
ncbi:hypothetical protein BV25DRAFT_1841634 [Artomyces pyxidatus]|uniref:Uncharacterized protein n=1 Tax=Artomyces pyxidatus TaxID=48021 RepID=A0ACB8SMM8_9AGAM|nr:hypothetical protein BV25DRAFT_1841634 [Artomyces pyxidatus]